MVSFSCENCGDVLTKKKLDPHRGRCRGATFTCIDCMVYFPGFEYRAHTSCMTEDQKYQGALYKDKKQKQKGANGRQAQANANTNAVQATPVAAQTCDTNTNKNDIANLDPDQDMVPEHAYVEDVPDDCNVPPEAPSPPPAVPNPPSVNVFDFLVDNNTPAASHVNFFPQDQQIVRYDYENDGYVDPDGYMVDDDNEALVQYGDGPIPASETLRTPVQGQKTEPAMEKKRKRLHVEISDQVMTDAPPVLHTGLTGGLHRMMQFPPSPEFSGDNDEPPAPSPIKKTKHHDRNKSTSSSGGKGAKQSRHRSESLGSNLLAIVSGSGNKPAKKRKVAKKRSAGGAKTKRRASDGSDGKSGKRGLLEFKSGSRPSSRDSNEGGNNNHNQMVLYRPRADLFLSMVTKGPESERGCSINKALKRFRRERVASREGRVPSKAFDEKELWRSLRMRRNDRGEVVLFSLGEDE